MLCGARFLADLDIRDRWEALLVGVTAPFSVRYERARNSAKDGALTMEGFAALDQAPAEGDIDELVRRAGAGVANDGSQQALYEKVSELVKRL